MVEEDYQYSAVLQVLQLKIPNIEIYPVAKINLYENPNHSGDHSAVWNLIPNSYM